MRKSVKTFLISSFKLFLIVIAMTYFYPILGIVTLKPIIVLCQVPEEGNLIGTILMYGVQIVSILFISFLVGMLFPKDRWVVRPSIIITLLLCLIDDIGAGIYISKKVPFFPLFSYLKQFIIPYIFIFIITYLLAPLVHHYGSEIRSRLNFMMVAHR
jgi:hypothetical protein